MKTAKLTQLLILPALLMFPIFSQAQDSRLDRAVEAELATLAKKPASFETAKELFNLRDTPMPEKLKELVFRATAAALLYSGKEDVYRKNVAEKLSDSAEFERTAMDFCTACRGKGVINGKCPLCHGSGKCKKCKGEGFLIDSKCDKCQGRGRFVNKGKTLSIYNVSINSAAEFFEKERERKELEAQLEKERKEREAQLEKERKEREAQLEKERKEREAQLEKERKEREEREKLERAKREKERKEREEREKLERAKREKERKEREEREELERAKREAFEREQLAKGLVKYDGIWMTPKERDAMVKFNRLRNLVISKSITEARYKIFQIFDDGKALCTLLDYDRYRGWYQTDIVFCLHFSADTNRTVTEGAIFKNDLYWSGTYTYTTVKGARSKVTLYSIDIEEAMKEAIRQGFASE